MANIKSQIKRIGTNKKAQERNKAVKSEFKTAVRAARLAVTSGDKDKAVASLAIASKKLEGLAKSHADHAFYTGKIAAAQYYALNILPGVGHKAQIIALEDDSALTIPAASFATI